MIKKQTSLLILAIMLFNGYAFSLTYDPVTNTYINENAPAPQQVADSQDGQIVNKEPIGVDIETGTPIYEDDSSTITSTSGVQEDIDPNKISSIGTTPLSESQRAILTKDDWDGPLEYLHILLNGHIEMLHEQLDDNYEKLKDETIDLLSDTQSGRLEVLQCLGVLDSDFDSLNEVSKTYTRLKNEIDIVTTDLHSELSALESKIDLKLLTKLDENLQIASMQNKVNAYNNEYANIIDTYYELSRSAVQDADALIDSSNEAHKKTVEAYDKRVALYKKLEEKYDDFIKQSSFAGVLAGPNLQSLVETLNEVKVLYRGQFISQWKDTVQGHLLSSNSQFISDVYEESLDAYDAQFDAIVDDLLNGIYPIKELSTLNESMLAIRTGYIVKNGTYNCKAFSSNPTIDLAVPQLIIDMDKTLKRLNEGANRVASTDGIPRTVEDLKKGLIQALNDEGKKKMSSLVSQEKIRIEQMAQSKGVTRLPIAQRSETMKWEKFIRDFLQAKYSDALNKGTLSSFMKVLTNANIKIDNTLEIKKPTGKTKLMLETIQVVVLEFL